MAGYRATEQDQDVLRERAAKARLSAAGARTTQGRQHFEGMASYWEELLREQLTARSAAVAQS